MMGYVNNTTHPHYVYVKISAHHCQDGITFFVFDRSGGKVFFMAPVRGGGGQFRSLNGHGGLAMQ